MFFISLSVQIICGRNPIKKYKRNSNEISRNEEKIHCIRFADDIALVSVSEADMQKSLTTLTKILQEYQMKINVNKTKTMVVIKAKKKSFSEVGNK